LALGGIVADTATPTLAGIAEGYAEVLLIEGNSVIGSGTAVSSGAWDIETQALGLGYHTVTAELIDAAGNISPISESLTFEVVPPPPGEITLNDAAMVGAQSLITVGTVTDATADL